MNDIKSFDMFLALDKYVVRVVTYDGEEHFSEYYENCPNDDVDQASEIITDLVESINNIYYRKWGVSTASSDD